MHAQSLTVEITTKGPAPTGVPNVGTTILGPCLRKRNPVAPVTIQALSDFSLVCPKGSINLIIGGVGSGKTLALRALAGVQPAGRGVTVSFSGGAAAGTKDTKDGLTAAGAAFYVSAVDVHEPVLSVRETLEFAHAVSRTADPRLCVDALLRVCALEGVRDVRVKALCPADARKLTLAEALLAGRAALAVDEATDRMSAAEADAVVPAVLSLCRELGVTVALTARDPSPALLAVCDSVTLLCEGHTLYTGPVPGLAPQLRHELQLGRALDPTHHHSHGHHGHPTKGQAVAAAVAAAATAAPGAGLPLGVLAQALVTDPVGTAALYASQYDAASDAFTPAVLAAAWKQSGGGAAALAAANPLAKTTAAAADSAAVSKPVGAAGPPLSCSAAFGLLLRRQVRVVFRNPLFLAPKVALALFVGLLVGTVFFHSDLQNGAGRGASPLLASLGMIATCIPLAGVFGTQKSVSLRHAGLGWYGGAAYIPTTLLTVWVPNLIGAFITTAILYWMVDFSHDAGKFFWSVFALSTVITYTTHLAQFLTYWLNAAAANGLTSMGLLVALTSGGTFLTKYRLPEYFRYFFYYLTPVSYYLRSVMVLEYSDDRYSWPVRVGVHAVPGAGPNGTTAMMPTYLPYGTLVLNGLDMDREDSIVYGGPFYAIGCSLFFVLLTIAAMALRVRKGGEPVPPGTKRAAAVLPAATATAAAAAAAAAAAVAVPATASGDPAFEPALLAWRDVSYSLPAPKRKGKGEGKGAGKSTGKGSKVSADKADSPQPSSDTDADGEGDGVRVLHRSSGLAGPGSLTAVITLGPASAAPRALLSILGQRPVKGAVSAAAVVSLNGLPQPIDHQSPSPSTTTTATAGGSGSSRGRVSTGAHRIAVCYHDDALAPFETVEEVLWVSLRLRGTGSGAAALTTPEAQAAWVGRVMAICELLPFAHLPYGRLLSADPGAAARTRIAVELVANPSVLLVDQPLGAKLVSAFGVTGAGAASAGAAEAAAPTLAAHAAHARSVLRVLRRIADSGRTVIMSLHNPTPDALAVAAVDCKLLLCGSRQVYAGPAASLAPFTLAAAARAGKVASLAPHTPLVPAAFEVLSLLESLEEALDSAVDLSGTAAGGEHNAAAVALAAAAEEAQEAATAGAAAAAADTGAVVVVNPAGRSAAAVAAAVPPRLPGTTTTGKASRRLAASAGVASPELASEIEAWTQPTGGIPAASRYKSVQPLVPRAAYGSSQLWATGYNTGRLLRYGWRNTPVNLVRNFIFVFMGVFLGLLFYSLYTADFKGSNSLSAIVFFLCTTGAILCFTTILADGMAVVRPWYYRERAAGYYSSLAFSAAQGPAEVPFLALSSLTFNSILYFFAGLDPSRFGFHILAHLALVHSFGFFGHFVAGLAPIPPISGAIQGFFIFFNVVMAGSFIAPNQITDVMMWIHKAVPIAYGGKAIVLNIMHCEGPPLSPLPPAIPSPTMVAPAPANMLQEGCVWWMASLAPGQPTLAWDRYHYFAARWMFTYDDRFIAVGYLALFILAYRLAAVATWQLHWGKRKV